MYSRRARPLYFVTATVTSLVWAPSAVITRTVTLLVFAGPVMWTVTCLGFQLTTGMSTPAM